MTVYTRVDVVPQEGTGEISLVFWPSGISETSPYANYGLTITIPPHIAGELSEKLKMALTPEQPETDPEKAMMNSLDEIGRRLWDVADWMEARNDLAQEALVEAARDLLESASGMYRMQPHFTIICPGGCQL